jgi:hypothetical protein
MTKNLTFVPLYNVYGKAGHNFIFHIYTQDNNNRTLTAIEGSSWMEFYGDKIYSNEPVAAGEYRALIRSTNSEGDRSDCWFNVIITE